jgi:hypothetical protein
LADVTIYGISCLAVAIGTVEHHGKFKGIDLWAIAAFGAKVPAVDRNLGQKGAKIFSLLLVY